MKKERLVSLALSLTLAFSMAAPAGAYGAKNLVPQKRSEIPAFADTRGTWCDEAVQTCYEAGLLDGKSATRFAPKDTLTFAQITVITARLRNLLNGGDGSFDAPAAGAAWYQPAADSLTAALDADDSSAAYLLDTLTSLGKTAQEPCTRYDFVWFLSAILPDSALTPINQITALPDDQDENVLRFYNAGILTGSDAYGTFHGVETLNRGQAAAMLARVIDSTQRISFTPQARVFAQELLGLAPETPLLTVDGYSITAEIYAYDLLQNISTLQSEYYADTYKKYSEEFDAFLSDDYYTDFGDFMWDKYGVKLDLSIDWNAPDQGGMTPAQKLKENTLSDLLWLVSILSYEKDYPLTAAQLASIKNRDVPLFGSTYGFSQNLVDTLSRVYWIEENMLDAVPLSSADLNAYLKECGWIYGQYLVVFRGEDGQYESDESALNVIETARNEMIAHKNDPAYLLTLLETYGEGDTPDPSILSLDTFSPENRQALEQLPNGQVSKILKEDNRYLVVLKQDPSSDKSVANFAAWDVILEKLEARASSAKVTPAPAYSTIDAAKAAEAYLALDL